MHNPKVETFIKIIFLVSLVSIISAYFIEYALGHQPCNLCLIERIPYGLAIVLIISNHILIKNKRFIILLLILVFSFSLIISLYHFGIEQGIFEESTVCGLKDALKYNISRSIVLIPLIVTYFSGPLGLVIYWFLRIFYAKKISLHE